MVLAGCSMIEGILLSKSNVCGVIYYILFRDILIFSKMHDDMPHFIRTNI